MTALREAATIILVFATIGAGALIAYGWGAW